MLLSPKCRSSMAVIGFSDAAFFENPGDTCLFDGEMWHESRGGSVRSVKVTIFWNVTFCKKYPCMQVQPDVAAARAHEEAIKRGGEVGLSGPSGSTYKEPIPLDGTENPDRTGQDTPHKSGEDDDPNGSSGEEDKKSEPGQDMDAQELIPRKNAAEEDQGTTSEVPVNDQRTAAVADNKNNEQDEKVIENNNSCEGHRESDTDPEGKNANHVTPDPRTAEGESTVSASVSADNNADNDSDGTNPAKRPLGGAAESCNAKVPRVE